VLRGAARAGGAVTILAMTAGRALAKASQKSVAYQDTPKGEQQCDNCALFQAPDACKYVDGAVSPSGWCKVYVKKG
jgi:hypothetical protein